MLLACARGKPSRAKIAALFRIGESTLYRWLETWRSEGRREAKPHAGGPEPRLDAAALDELQAIVAEANDLSLTEYAERLQERAGVTASGPTVSRALQKLGLPRKKRPGGRRSRTGPILSPRARPGGPSWPTSSHDGWCSSMRAGSTPA